jgi:hypothetical protein
MVLYVEEIRALQVRVSLAAMYLLFATSAVNMKALLGQIAYWVNFSLWA